jgi:O-antigen/teichoic acid export membrane protein
MQRENPAPVRLANKILGKIPPLAKISSIGWAFVGLAGPTLLQLVYMVLAARILGADITGNFFLIVSCAMIASSFVGLGGGGLALRDTARDHAAAPAAVGRAQAMTLLTFPILLIPVVFAARYVTHGSVPWLLIVLIASSDLVAMRSLTTFWSMFIGREEQIRGSLLICLMPIARIVSLAGVLFVDQDQMLNFFAYGYTIASFVVLFAATIYVQRRIGRVRLSLRGFDRKSGTSFALTWLNQALQTESDKLILSLFTTPAAVAVYAVASRLMDGAFMPPRALKNVMQARMFREGALGHKGIFKLTLKIMPLTIAYGLLAWLGFVVLAPLAVWAFGPSFSALAHILPIFGALPLLRATADFGAEIFLSSDRPGIQAMTQTFTTVLRIGLGFVLIASYQLMGGVFTALAVNLVSGSILWFLAWRNMQKHIDAHGA